MSDPVSALNGARYSGRVTVTEAGLVGMVTIRCDLAGATAKSAIGRIAGGEVPGQGRVTAQGGHSLLWMSPDELLLLCPHAEAPNLAARLGETLQGRPHLVADVSDARALFDVTGPEIRDVLAKLTPADLRPHSFGPGQIRRTRLAQVPAAIWLTSDDHARLIAFRSVSEYVFGLLKTAADPGAAVGYF